MPYFRAAVKGRFTIRPEVVTLESNSSKPLVLGCESYGDTVYSRNMPTPTLIAPPESPQPIQGPDPLVEATRPPLKWAGGKRWQVPYLQPYWEPNKNRRLVEPFCGGLAVALGLAPERALLNDINSHLINFYQWLKRGLLITLPMSNAETKFYFARKQFNKLLRKGHGDSAEATSLFYYMNRTGYNGLCRFNSSGQFNVPFGRYKTINYRRDFLEGTQLSLRTGNSQTTTSTRLRLIPQDLRLRGPALRRRIHDIFPGGFGMDRAGTGSHVAVEACGSRDPW